MESPAYREFIVWLRYNKGLHFAAGHGNEFLLVTMYDPAGLTRRLSYDGAGRLAEV